MKRTSKKINSKQEEFEFSKNPSLLGAPAAEARRSCCGPIPEQKTQLPWVPIFADRPPGPNRFSTRKP